MPLMNECAGCEYLVIPVLLIWGIVIGLGFFHWMDWFKEYGRKDNA